MLAQALLRLKFWWDAFQSTVFVINRLSTPVLNHNSPYHMLFNTSPDCTYLKVFGCSCYPYLRPYNTYKFQYRSTKCLFLGYSPVDKGYRCLSPSGRVYIASTLNFNESESPYPEIFLPPA